MFLRKKISFLNEIPNDIYFNLDISEFCVPDEEILRVQRELESVLGHNVMVYNSKVFNKDISIERHLCA